MQAMRPIIWQKLVTRPQTALTVDLIIKGLGQELVKLTGLTLNARAEIRDGMGAMLEDTAGRKHLNHYFQQKATENSAFYRQHLVEGRKRLDYLIMVSQQIKFSPLPTNRAGLIRLLNDYVAAFYHYVPILYTVFSPEVTLTVRLKASISTHLPKDMRDKYFLRLTSVPSDSDFYLEQKELLEIASRLEQGKDVSSNLAEHAQTYGYMGLTNSFLSRPYDVSYFSSLIEGLENPAEKLQTLVSQRQAEKEQYLQLIRALPSSLTEVAELLQAYMVFRNDRITGLKIAQMNLQPLLRQIAKCTDVSFEDLVWYRIDEIERLLQDGSGVDITRRKKHYLVELIDGQMSYSDIPFAATTEKLVKSFRGSTAQPGKTKGRVKIVLSAGQAKNLAEKDVLVTTMTTPDLMEAIRRSAAIVTDEGGILCHAAIVSREFGIPCIVGTKIATQVLKDGNLVEVDADKGVVTILN